MKKRKVYRRKQQDVLTVARQHLNKNLKFYYKLGFM